MMMHNLPHQSNAFVGRAEELAQISSLLADPNCSLLTIVGAGGVGKSRLALQAAAEQIPRFANGVFFVPLTSVGSTDLLAGAVANALEVSFSGSGDPRLQLVNYLREKQILLLMDNFEHLMDASDLLADILQSAAGVKFLVTSRERLNVREEWVLMLEGLSYPDDQAPCPLESYSAVQLFVQRARQVKADFSLSENSEAVKTICQQVEGIPLAIELAATWLRAMSCRQIAAQISGGLDFLNTPLRNVPERHRSMFAVFQQSWNRLTPAEQAVLMRLSVFRGGFDLEAAEQVAGASLVLLAGLADKSLIRLNAKGRYDLHELLRQFAADKVQEAGEADTNAECHCDYFLTLAERAEAHVFGREQIPWFDRLEVEFDNFRKALLWSLQSGNAETGLRLAAALGWFFSERTYWNEGLDWLERLLAATPDAPASLRAKAFFSAGALAGLLEDVPHTRALCEQALALARSANDRWSVAWSLSHLGNYIINKPDESTAYLEESLAIFRELGDAMGITHALGRRAWKAIQEQRDYAYGRVLLEEGTILTYEVGDKVLTAWLQYFLGLIACFQDNDLRQAGIRFESSMLLFREARCPFLEPIILLGDVEQATGNTARAQRLYEETLISLQKNMILHPYLSWVLAGLVNVRMSLGQLERAAQLLGAANRIGLDEQRNSPDVANFGNGAGAAAALRAQLGEAAFEEAWAAGYGRTPAQIITYALEAADDTANARPQQTAASPLHDTLKAREIEVLRLLAAGYSNREIAQELILAPSTVKWYVHELLSKLDVTNRTQAGLRARELGLLS